MTSAIRLRSLTSDWDKPQISATLPDGNLAVYNANTAESKGFEFEARGSLLLPGLSYSVGGAYADAKLTSSFSLPANNGAGVITPGLISGSAGDQLPGSPKSSLTATIIYERDVAPGYDSFGIAERNLSQCSSSDVGSAVFAVPIAGVRNREFQRDAES